MNRCYRLIWNTRLAAWAVPPEFARARGKWSAIKRVAAGVLAAAVWTAPAVHAGDLPTGGAIAAGQGAIAQSGREMTVTQDSDKLIVNWQQFDIGAQNTVTFDQPGADAMALNRVVGNDPSEILGQLNANGQVWLINPNGVLFGESAQVNVGGLVASTLDIANDAFLQGNYTLSGDGASVVNHGDITARSGGYIALIGGRVSNQGTIRARLGTVALGAGEQVTLDFAGDQLLSLSVDKAALNALAENRQLIRADGGTVILTAKAADAVLDTVVNNTGIIEARTIERENGVIKLLGGFNGGTVKVAGKLDASAPNGGDGGFIDTSGHTVTIAPDAKITTAAPRGETGTWLIDPTDFTIAAGGGARTTSSIGADTLSGALGSSNVQIATAASGTQSGDINVDSAVSWSANQLTLTAHRNININASLNGTGTAKLALEYGQSAVAAGNTATYHVSAPVNLPAGNNFSTKLGSDGATVQYTVINSLTTLQGIQNNLGGHYALGGDIDASATAGWNGGAGFDPVGDNTNRFTGTFDGLGHTISGLIIDRPTTNSVGLFGDIGSGAVVRNVGLAGGSVTGNSRVGGLVGGNSGTISQSYATGAVSGNWKDVGGLVGVNRGAGTISQSYATGAVSSDNDDVGGLVGGNSGTISQSYATGAVSGSNFAGGLSGDNSGTISQAYATGAVSGDSYLGGLVGGNVGPISHAYATGAVSGDSYLGGLVGYNDGGTISQTYATGAVSGDSYLGGLAGYNDGGTISDSYWATDTTGQAQSAGSPDTHGLTTAQIRGSASFTTWDIAITGGSDAVWRIYEGRTAPLLRSFLTPLTVSADDAAKTYDGAAWSGGTLSYSGFNPGDDASDLLGTGTFTGAAEGARNAGTYSIVSGQYSGQQGYDIDFTAGTLTISKAPISAITGITADNKVYDGNTNATLDTSGAGFTGMISGDALSVTTATGAFADKNAGSGKTVNITGLTLGGIDAGNYTLAETTASTTADITPKALRITVAGADKVQDGDTATTVTLQGNGLPGEELILNYTSARFEDAPVGSGKTLTVSGIAVTGVDAGNYIWKTTLTIMTAVILPSPASDLPGVKQISPEIAPEIARDDIAVPVSLIPSTQGLSGDGLSFTNLGIRLPTGLERGKTAQ